MKTYTFLAKIPLLKNRFPLKILFVAFVGIHIPLFAIIGYLLISKYPMETAKPIALLVLVFTLLATALTLFLLHKLLKPMMLAKNALKNYIQFTKVPELPTEFKDEAGKLMADIQRAINDLEHYEEERRTVLHILSHDLQSPVRSALSVVYLLKESEGQREREELYKLLEDSLSKQLEQLRFYLNLLKQERLDLKLDLTKDEISIPDLINEVVNDFQIDLDQKNIELKKSLHKKSFKLPKHTIQKALKNIIDNAIKHSPFKSRIEIQSEIECKYLHIHVKDYGTGFSPEETEMIFKYSSPLQKSGNSNIPSSGIGMFLSKNMVNRIGGDISATSEGLGKGAKFTISYFLDE